MFDDKKYIMLAEKIRIGLITFSVPLIVYYLYKQQYFTSIWWIFLLITNTIFFIHDSQRRGKINESRRNIEETKIKRRRTTFKT